MTIRPTILQLMRQQYDVRQPEEDWTGISDRVLRRKLQNRLHQRLYRKRRVGLSVTRIASTRLDSHTITPSSEEVQPLWYIFNAISGISIFDETTRLIALSICVGSFQFDRLIATEIQQWARYIHRSPSPFADQLLVLKKVNVFRAFLSNSQILGFPIDSYMQDDACSPFCSESHPSGPSALYPTELQKQIPHHPWIDLLPFPKMRDNLLLAEFDDLELCGDLVGMFSASSLSEAGLIVWGNPWSIDEWEVTQEFLTRWRWTMAGCEELLEATNRWRARRYEKPLLM